LLKIEICLFNNSFRPETQNDLSRSVTAVAAIHLPTQLVSSRRRRDKNSNSASLWAAADCPQQTRPVHGLAWPIRVRRQAKQCSHDMTSGWRLTRMARRVCKCPDGRPPGVHVPRPPAGCASAPANARRYLRACCQPRRLTQMARRVGQVPRRPPAGWIRPPAGCASAPTDEGRYPKGVLPTSPLALTQMARRVGQVPRRPLAGCASAPAARRVCECPD